MLPARIFIFTLIIVWSSVGLAQEPRGGRSMAKGEHDHRQGRNSNEESLSEQISNLGKQVSLLATNLEHQGVDIAAMQANGASYRAKMSMGNVSDSTMQRGGAQIPPAMGMMAGMANMMSTMMGGMGGNPSMGQSASLGPSTFISSIPGFPGASHLYHIGASNFFLDHPEHISLSLEQQSRLAALRSNALLSRADYNRKIQEVEEQIWILTASGQPNLSSIEAKIRESEKLQSDARLAYIKDVGEAASILTQEQRLALVGIHASDFDPSAMSTAKPKEMGGM